MSDLFFYWQKSGGEEPWQVALASTRQQVIDVEQPRFITVLDVSAVIDDSFTREQIEQLKYRGPLYFDFDAADLQTALDKFQQFLGKLLEYDVDLHACRLYATGGRGFHIEIPQEMFMAKVPKQGTVRLPLIYREIAQELYVDTLDLRVYSTRRGRMWRTPGVRRENGKYKVAITPEEAANMTAEDYEAICSQPRTPPTTTPPALNNKLAVLYAKAEAKIEAASKKKKSAKKDEQLLAKFNGEMPPSLLKVLAGETVAPNTGFHKIALQAAITANALGWTEEKLLAVSEGLCEKHQSDGHRYNTPKKRREELSRLYRYTQDNPCYSFRADAVKALLPKSEPALDLLGLSEEQTGEMTAGAGGDDDEEADSSLHGGLFVTEKGVFKKSEGGAIAISDLSFRDVHLLYSIDSGDAIGFEAEILVKGKSHGRQLIDTSYFLSKQRYVQFCMRYMGAFKGVDNDAVSISTILRDTAMKNDKVVYVTNREGLDLIQRPDTSEPVLDFVWVSPDTIETDSPVNYKHRGMPSPHGIFKSDLVSAPDLEASDRTVKVIDSLLKFNEPYVVSNMLGWFTASFQRQVYQRLFEQFPLLQIFGQAGSGKTKSVETLLRMHYYLSTPIILQADSSTRFAISSAMQSSASIPVVLDEFKPRQFRPGQYAALLQMMRSAYSAGAFAKGGMSQEPGASWRDVSTFAYSAPVLFIGEALETETAMLERTVSVPVSKVALTGREEYHYTLRDNMDVLSSLGKEIVRATFALDLEAFKRLVQTNQAEANKIAFKRNNHRVVYNLAVVMTGLEFLDQLLRHEFGEMFVDQFQVLRAAMMDISKHVSVSVMPEAAKVLNILAFMSKTEPLGSETYLAEGVDYAVTETTLDLKMRNVYYKYVAWARRKGQVPLYDNEEAFIHGLSNFGACIDRAGLGSKLKDPKLALEKVFRFSLKTLEEEGVETFRA